MTTSLTPDVTPFVPTDGQPGDSPTMPPTDPWQHLTDDDATRIAAAVAANHAEATRTVYAHAWRHWLRRCAGRGLVGFPAEPALLCEASRV